MSPISKQKCSSCKIEKDFSNFCSVPGTKEKRCKDCLKAKNLRAKLNGSKRRADLKRTYGITPKDYDEMILKQNGKCDICKEDPTRENTAIKNETILIPVDFTRFLHIDHNHITNKVRGLLCGNCNRALGLFKDNILRLENAILYLKKNM
jgi:hypothetical protein